MHWVYTHYLTILKSSVNRETYTTKTSMINCISERFISTGLSLVRIRNFNIKLVQYVTIIVARPVTPG